LTAESELVTRIRKSNLEEVEATWNARLSGSPRELRWFFDVAREMRTIKAHARMSELMLLLVDALAVDGEWEPSFDALREALDLVPKNRDVRAKVAEAAQSRYAGRVDLAEALAFFDVENAEDPVRAFDRLRAWLRFSRGEGFWLFGRGLGKVHDTNLALQRIEIRFEKAGPLVIRADEAQRLLTWIPAEHFMMRRLADPAGVAAEALKDPGEFVHQLFRCFRRPLAAAEIKECMSSVVDASKWTTFWNRARAHPQLLASRDKKGAFEWTESAETADRAVIAEFDAADHEKRFDLARKHARRGGEVEQRILARLATEMDELTGHGHDPARAVELHCLLEELGALKEPPVLALDDLLAREDAAYVVTGVGDRRYREKLYRRVRSVREDWLDVFRSSFLEETDQRLLSLLYDEMRGGCAPGFLEKLVAEIVSAPRRAPRAFIWVSRNVLEREELRGRANLSLLTKVVDSLESPEFKELRAPLREAFEEGGLAFQVFEGLDLDGAERLLNLLDASSLEEHRKVDIRRIIFRRFPHIRKRVDDDVLPATLQSVEGKRRELEVLVKQEIPQNAEAIRVAREFGDLRENFEYHAARAKHEILNARAARLHTDLAKVRLLDPAAVDVSRVSVGTRVDLEPVQGGSLRTVTILGPWESNPDQGIYSHQSEYARDLLGLSVGDTVSLEEVEYRVRRIGAWMAPGAVSPGPGSPGEA
jgi:transcription elongation GreA/GreB family factor